MATPITQTEIMKYRGVEKAIFPRGTIITPSAADCAREHKIKIVIEGMNGTACGYSAEDRKANNPVNSGMDKQECLQRTIKAVFNEYREKRLSPAKEDVIKAVIECLKRLNCRVEE